MYGEGISQEGELLDMASDKDIVNKSGAWYSYNDEKIGQGRENSKKFLADNPDIMQEIYEKVRMAYNMDGVTLEEVEEDVEDLGLDLEE